MLRLLNKNGQCFIISCQAVIWILHRPSGFAFKMLSSLDAVHISAVLEDCVDQLAILGHIMPPSLEGRSDAGQIVDDELGQILQDQRFLESRYEAVRQAAFYLGHATDLWHKFPIFLSQSPFEIVFLSLLHNKSFIDITTYI